MVKVHQDASVYLARLEPGTEVTHQLAERRGAYVYLIDGAASFDGQDVSAGDAARVLHQPELRIVARETSELILVDVPLIFDPKGIWKG